MSESDDDDTVVLPELPEVLTQLRRAASRMRQCVKIIGNDLHNANEALLDHEYPGTQDLITLIEDVYCELSSINQISSEMDEFLTKLESEQ